ncbi:MAG: hypothetical protein JWQ89_3797 [Devosia sp.]|uniref:DUF883 family protein n=1 Tax=Devosia sp. TaxID=1871048 RepID=UPI00263212BE|nr:hypothetical protein [Devosia sp.]MDB5542070.1 hypothetical protein [Devosia sp.]
MASTTDMAPNRTTPATPTRRASNGPRRAAARASAAARNSSREDDLAAQVTQLQSDLKSIAATLANLAGDKVNDAQAMAKREAKSLAKSGQHAVEDIQDEFGQIERQIKDTIREKPLTAVAGAIALGFMLAVVTR